MTYIPTRAKLSLTQLRHPSTLAKIVTAWGDVLTVSNARKGRAVRYVLDRKGKEWIRFEKSPESPVVAYFRGYGSEDHSDLIRALLETEGVTFNLPEVPPTGFLARAVSFLKRVYQ